MTPTLSQHTKIYLVSHEQYEQLEADTPLQGLLYLGHP